MKFDSALAFGQRLRPRKIRFAVVGLGCDAEKEILPAFSHAELNCKLAAILSDDPLQLRAARENYRVERALGYPDYGKLLRSGFIDAVYIALPHQLHLPYALEAAQAGIHVLCEQPLAASAAEARRIINACRPSRVNIMAAGRLYFQAGNLEAIQLARSGEIGEPRIFCSSFSERFGAGQLPVKHNYARDTLFDVGIHCINTARYIFRAEPIEVACFLGRGHDPRLRLFEEMASAVMRFPGDRLATFSASFGAARESGYEILGTKGKIRVRLTHEESLPLSLDITGDHQTRHKEYPMRDQVAPELEYFSRCILEGVTPEPSGEEALMDLKIIEALCQSAENHAPVRLRTSVPRRRDGLKPASHCRKARPSVWGRVRRPLHLDNN